MQLIDCKKDMVILCGDGYGYDLYRVMENAKHGEYQGSFGTICKVREVNTKGEFVGEEDIFFETPGYSLYIEDWTNHVLR